MEPVNMVYMTAGSKDEAFALGKELVANKLAACVNVIDNMQSIFEWEGEVQHDTEVVLIAKTTATRTPELIEMVQNKHSYDCPCVVCLPVSNGNPAFLEWIGESVSPA
ncbi:MAG TPA: divalent-cation tolerance protein CutA [Desulfosalsimonadaceae bacterium]|nr:divalent-cation tolerance protein CutA [Desulfosalsimonadaceae bacterium]